MKKRFEPNVAPPDVGPPSQENDYEKYSRFLVTGDPHLAEGLSPWKLNPKEFGEHVNSLDNHYPLDFAVELGDLDVGKEKGFIPNDAIDNNADFISMIEGSAVPFFHVSGDHDGMWDERWMERTCMPPKSYYYLKDGILHIFLSRQVSLALAGQMSAEQQKFVEYLVEHKYPNKTTFIYSHYGVYPNSPGWIHWMGGLLYQPGMIRPARKFANYRNTEWWNNLFEENPQIKIYFTGHTHNSIYNRHSWVEKKGVLFIDQEAWVKPETQDALNPLNVWTSGSTLESTLVTINENKIHIVPYNLNSNKVQLKPPYENDDFGLDYIAPQYPKGKTIKGPTSFNSNFEDEFGAMRVFLDNRKILNYNHIIGKERKIEIVKPDTRNLMPDPEFRNTSWKGGPLNQVKAIGPFWESKEEGLLTNIISKEIKLILLFLIPTVLTFVIGFALYGKFKSKNNRFGKTIMILVTIMWIVSALLGSLFIEKTWSGIRGKYQYNPENSTVLINPDAGDSISPKRVGLSPVMPYYHNWGVSPAASEGVEFKLNVRLKSDKQLREGLKLKLHFQTCERDAKATTIKTSEEKIDVDKGWKNYTLISKAPAKVKNPDWLTPRFRVVPEIKFNKSSKFVLDSVYIVPNQEGSTENLINPTLKIDNSVFEKSLNLGDWKSTDFSIPLQKPREVIKMSGSGGRMGLLLLTIVEPKIQTWSRPAKTENMEIIFGESRAPQTPDPLPKNAYLKSLDRYFTTENKLSENQQTIKKLVIKNNFENCGIKILDIKN